MIPKFILTAAIAATLGFALAPTTVRAADHADSPTVANDQGADIADIYAFMDPNVGSTDNVVLIGTFRGFIPPGENGNFGTFDAGVRYRFSIENTGDFKADKFIDVTFSKKEIIAPATSASQTAKITITGFKGFFEAPISPINLATASPEPTITTLTNAKHPDTGIKFSASLTDDPFFFDIPGFNRFVAKALAGTPNAKDELLRGRDTFAGYNVLSIAISIPKASLLATAKKNFVPPTTLGINFSTSRKTESVSKGEKKGSGGIVQVDRMGIPGVNVVFIPLNFKNAYNGGSFADDSKGAKFGPLIGGTLTALGTDPAVIDILAGLVGLPNSTHPKGTGDYLRLDTAVANGSSTAGMEDTKKGGGAGPGGFPNGRRLRDDIIDIVLSFVAPAAGGDHVDGNDKPLRDVFPFLAPSQQPREGAGNVEDNTRN